MNLRRIKRGLRRSMQTWNKHHPKDQIVISPMSPAPFWGKNAKTNFWRLTEHVHHLRYDQQPTAQLVEYLFPPTPAQRLRSAIVHGYTSLLGVREGSAKQKAIAAFSGLSWTLPWCAMTAWFVLKKLAAFNGGGPDNVAFVPSWELWAQAKGILVSHRNALAGMFVTFRWSGPAKVGTGDHIGVIVKAGLMRHTVQYSLGTMEGNATGSPDGVFTETRWWYQINCIIDPAQLQRPT